MSITVDYTQDIKTESTKYTLVDSLSDLASRVKEIFLAFIDWILSLFVSKPKEVVAYQEKTDHPYVYVENVVLPQLIPSLDTNSIFKEKPVELTSPDVIEIAQILDQLREHRIACENANLEHQIFMGELDQETPVPNAAELAVKVQKAFETEAQLLQKMEQDLDKATPDALVGQDKLIYNEIKELLNYARIRLERDLEYYNLMCEKRGNARELLTTTILSMISPEPAVCMSNEDIMAIHQKARVDFSKMSVNGINIEINVDDILMSKLSEQRLENKFVQGFPLTFTHNPRAKEPKAVEQPVVQPEAPKEKKKNFLSKLTFKKSKEELPAPLPVIKEEITPAPSHKLSSPKEMKFQCPTEDRIHLLQNYSSEKRDVRSAKDYYSQFVSDVQDLSEETDVQKAVISHGLREAILTIYSSDSFFGDDDPVRKELKEFVKQQDPHFDLLPYNDECDAYKLVQGQIVPIEDNRLLVKCLSRNQAEITAKSRYHLVYRNGNETIYTTEGIEVIKTFTLHQNGSQFKVGHPKVKIEQHSNDVAFRAIPGSHYMADAAGVMKVRGI